MTPQRGRWVLAEQPGREVTAVRDAESALWLRHHGDTVAEDTWSPADDFGGLVLGWVTLLVEFGPLDEAEPGERPAGVS